MTIAKKIDYVIKRIKAEKIDYVIKRIKEGDKPIIRVDNNESIFEFKDGTEIPLYDQDAIHALAGALDIEVPL